MKCGINANGVLCFGPAFFVSAAFILSITASSLCNFVKLDDDNPLRPGDVFTPRGVDSVGMWCYEPVGSSSRFEIPDIVDDDDLEKARAFSLTANIIGFIVWLIYLFMGCVPFPPTVIVFTGFLCELVCLFEGLKFWIFKTLACDGGCSIDTAARCSISAACLWFVAGCMTCGVGKERTGAAENDNADPEPQQQQKQQQEEEEEED